MNSNASASHRGGRSRLSDEDYRALGGFRHALRRFLAVSEAGAQAVDLTPQQHQALLAIRAHADEEAISIGELAASLLIRNHSAVGLVDRLAQRGLVRRTPSLRDKRRVLIELTPQAAEILEGISRTNLAQLKGSLPAFNELLQSLDKLELPPPSLSPSA